MTDNQDKPLAKEGLVSVRFDPDAPKWQKLIDQICKGNVIPVVGNDILVEGMDFEQQIIDMIAEWYGITSHPTNFSELLYDPQFDYRNREGIYSMLASLWAANESTVRPSSLLKRILSIRQFPFVISTSVFPVVEMAMNASEVWGGRKVRSMVFSNNPSTTMAPGIGDLASPADMAVPTVYYMFGRVSNKAHQFVVTDTDMLSFCRSWLSSETRPAKLSNVLKDKYLLVLGSNYPDWLFRFIWYSMNWTMDPQSPFSTVQGMMVDDHADDSLVRFLNRLDTFTHSDPEKVVDRIEKMLSEQESDSERQHFRNLLKDCDVFISYSRTDEAVAKALYDALVSRGLTVWYDRANLQAGSAWRDDIQMAIETCRLFVPILSENVEKEGNEYHTYRREWKIADRLSDGYNRAFVIPLACRTFDFAHSSIPQSFKERNALFYDESDLSLNDFADRILSIINSL